MRSRSEPGLAGDNDLGADGHQTSDLVNDVVGNSDAAVGCVLTHERRVQG